MTQEKKQDYTLRISQANKTALITILYEMVIDYCEEAIEAHAQISDTDSSASERFDSAISLADACIDELIGSLHLEYELAQNLLGLYLFEKRQLLHARIHATTQELTHIIHIFSQFRDAYAKLQEQDSSGPVMVNVPKVYAGMTYGRGDLSENVTGAWSNRGFTA